MNKISSQAVKMLLSAGVMGLCVCPLSSVVSEVMAQPLQSASLNNSPALAHQTPHEIVGMVESRIYGQQYSHQMLMKRLNRLEKTVFGQQASGTIHQRVYRLYEHVRFTSSQEAVVDSKRMIEYLEQRLFQESHTHHPLPKRVNDLELALFGVVDAHLPLQSRIQRLLYSTPLQAKEVRLYNEKGQYQGSSEGQNRVSRRSASPTTAASPGMVTLSPNEESLRNSGEHSPVPLHITMLNNRQPQIKNDPSPNSALRLLEFRPGEEANGRTAVQRIQVPFVKKKKKRLAQGAAPDKAVVFERLKTAQHQQVPKPAPLPQGTAKPLSSAAPLPPWGQSAPPEIEPKKSRPVLLETDLHPSAQPSSEETTSFASRQGEYSAYIYRLNNGDVLRWMTTPVQVYSRSMSNAENRELVQQAMASWSHAVPLVFAQRQSEANIVVDWTSHYGQVVTQPILALDANRQIRYSVYISMAPYGPLPPNEKLRSLTHQMGHALGLWGHSPNPSDVMYPKHRLEYTDYPKQWQSNMFFPQGPHSTKLMERPMLTSSQDLKTLKMIYNLPGRDLKFFKMYH